MTYNGMIDQYLSAESSWALSTLDVEDKCLVERHITNLLRTQYRATSRNANVEEINRGAYINRNIAQAVTPEGLVEIRKEEQERIRALAEQGGYDPFSCALMQYRDTNPGRPDQLPQKVKLDPNQPFVDL